MVANEHFFARRQAAAVLKHGILRRYPTVFASMAGYGEPEVVLYDAYAGPGEYEDGSPGSPLLLVQTAMSVNGFRNVTLYFSEDDIDNHTNLHRALTEAAGDSVRWEAEVGSVEIWARPFVAQAGRAPMFTFLDPFGVGCSYDVLTKTLLGRDPSLKTEVLLNINVESVQRIGGRLTENGGRPATGAERTLERVDRFLGGPWWRETFLAARAGSSTGRAADAAVEVVDEFCRRVKRDTGFDAFRVPIRRRPGHVPHFILTLFYRNENAPWKFNDSASKANVDWRRACMEEDLEREEVSVTPSLFGDEAETRSMLRATREQLWEEQERALEAGWVETITGNLERLVVERGHVALGENVVEVYGETLGLAREMHVRKAWDALAGLIPIEPRDTKLKSLGRGTIRRVV